MTHATPPDPALLPDWLHAVLLVAFGVSTAGLILFFDSSGLGRLDLLLLASSLGAVLTAGLWITLLGLRRSTGWALALCGAIWIPYVNFVIASIYARRYWSEGARTPALLAIAGMIGQTLASLRLLFAGQPPLV